MRPTRKFQLLSRVAFHYSRKSSRLPYLPVRLWIEPTNRCNLRCTVCPNSTDDYSPRGIMDYALFERLIEQIAGHAYDINLSHRGESLFHPRLLDMISLCRQQGIRTRLHTNATLLTPKLSRQLILAGLNLISFSCDGFTRETYERIRRGGDFEQVVSNILGFLREKRELGKKQPYTVLQVIQTEGTPEPAAQAAFIRRFSELPLDKLYLKQPHNWAGSVPVEACGQAGERAASACTFPWYALTVLWDGSVTPCPQDWYGSLIVGNLNSQSLWEIWNGAPLQDLRNGMKQRQVNRIEPCKSCDRITRPTIIGVPYENMRAFLGETVFGYRLVRKVIKR